MRRIVLLILFSVLACGSFSAQAQEGTDNQIQPAEVSTAQVPLDAAVITLNGLCDNGLVQNTPVGGSQAGGQTATAAGSTFLATDPGCKTVVTREEFDKLAKAVGVRPGRGLALASQYSEILRFAEKGRELALEKEPTFLAKARFAYIQTLYQFAIVKMQEQADDFTAADLEKYHTEHNEEFMQVEVSQLAIPKHKVHDDGGAAAVKKAHAQVDPVAEQAAMKRLAERMRREAAAGADFDALEERIYKIAGDESVPDTDLGIRYPDQVPLEYRKIIFDLKPGQVSQVTEDSHEYLIFKARKKHVLPLSESTHWYGQLRMRAMRRQLNESVKADFNDLYFPKTAENKPSGAQAKP
jgi:hypothetical protein